MDSGVKIAGAVEYRRLGNSTIGTVAEPEIAEFDNNDAIGLGLQVSVPF